MGHKARERMGADTVPRHSGRRPVERMQSHTRSAGEEEQAAEQEGGAPLHRNPVLRMRQPHVRAVRRQKVRVLQMPQEQDCDGRHRGNLLRQPQIVPPDRRAYREIPGKGRSNHRRKGTAIANLKPREKAPATGNGQDHAAVSGRTDSQGQLRDLLQPLGPAVQADRGLNTGIGGRAGLFEDGVPQQRRDHSRGPKLV